MPCESLSQPGEADKPRAVFRVRFSRIAFSIILGVSFLVLGSALLWAVVSGLLAGRGNGEWSKGLAFGLGLAGSGAFLLLFALTNRRSRVLVYSHGFGCVDGKLVDFIGWDEIVTIQRASTGNNAHLDPDSLRYRLVVSCVDGRTFEFGDKFSRLKELRTLLEEETLSHLLRAAIQDYDAGKSVAFGPLSVTPQGVHNGTRTLPWNEVEQCAILRRKIVILQWGNGRPWKEISVSEVPNSHVIAAMVNQLASRHQQDS